MFQKENQREQWFRYESNPEHLWFFSQSKTESGPVLWRVGPQHPQPEVAEQRIHLEQMADYVTELEATRARLEAELLEEKKVCKSLREDLSNFSTFEQICNSGMLRNFKIDSESPFAQVILRLLQRTMELQISHLEAPDPETELDQDEKHTGVTGIQPTSDHRSAEPNGTVRPLEGTA